jgi:mannitol/fructose-specific phosphotransferase system IIA component (Ntr-type)
MKLYNSLKPELIKIDCSSTDTEGLLSELIYQLKLQNKVSNQENILQKLMEREKLGSTSIGNHAAVPHTKLKDIKEPIIAIGTSKAGFLYNDADKEPVHLIILILSPNFSPIIHLQILAAAASLIKKPGRLIQEVKATNSAEELISVIQKYETSDD